MHRVLVIISLGCSLASCGAFEAEEKADIPDDQDEAVLTGVWASNCTDADRVGLTRMEQVVDFADAGQFSRIEQFFPGSDCAVPTINFSLAGTFDNLGTHPENPEVERVNFNVSTAYLTVGTSEGVAATVNQLNDLALCGRTDWSEGKQIDITGVDCAGVVYGAGDVIFETFSLREGNLFFGSRSLFLNDEGADGRPSDVDTSVVFTKT